jgi:hypothetical protein
MLIHLFSAFQHLHLLRIVQGIGGSFYCLAFSSQPVDRREHWNRTPFCKRGTEGGVTSIYQGCSKFGAFASVPLGP